MAMSIKQDGDTDETPMSDINTTPLVDVMLVLLIIFLITIPVVKQAAHVDLPKITNIETKPKPENIELTITADGSYYEGAHKFPNQTALKEYIKTKAVIVPQPEVHIRADREVPYGSVGGAMFAVQQGGIVKVAFLTEPPPK